jgi:diacylglycerol O-acyltransferase
MGHYKYERLSARDNDFLLWEKPNLPMHVGSTQIFEVGPLASEGGGVDFDTIKRGVEGILHKIPRYREKLAWMPGEEHAVWVDDPNFNLEYHMRHMSLPRPGSDEQLKELVARIMERPLDRARPLWEIWVVEGLQGERFATIAKTHQCMTDGVGGMALARNLFSTSRDHSLPEPRRFVPRPQPGAGELRWDEWLRRLGMPRQVLGELGDFVRNNENPAREIASRVRALGQLAWRKAVPASDSPLNGPVGPHRIFDWLTLSLADVKAVGQALRCSVNDVVLAAVTGGVREFMIHRQVRPEDLDFRVASPVDVRGEREDARYGNRVSTWLLRLPIGEADPLMQVAEIARSTQKLRESHQAGAIETLEAIHEWIPIDLQRLSAGTQNTFVSNIPGPQVPLYLLGAELLSVFIQPPLIENLGLALGVISYNGEVGWGFNADYDRVPDIGDLVGMVRASFEVLAGEAGVKLEGVRPLEVRAEPQRRRQRRAPSREGASSAAPAEPVPKNAGSDAG